eukprot:gene1485-1723_t
MSAFGNSSTGSSIGSPMMSGSPLDNDKVQKIVANYQKIKTQNAVLKKAIIQEQQKSVDLDRELKEKDQALVTAMQEHDALDFNNQRLTKRLQTFQDQMNEKKEGGSWGFFGSKQEMQKKEDEIALLRHELQEKIDDNENLHGMKNEKDTAFKLLEGQLRQQLQEREDTIAEKDKKINELIDSQKASELNLLRQTQGLRENIEDLQDNIKSFESLVFDKDFSLDIDESSINTLTNTSNWKAGYRSMISNLQSIFSLHLTQLSNIVGSHHDIVGNKEKLQLQQINDLNDNINHLTLQKEENAFNLNSIKEELSQKEQALQMVNRDLAESKEFLEQLSGSNKDFEDQLTKVTSEAKATKQILEKEIDELKTNHKNEMKQTTDQHQGLLKHQKQMLSSTIDKQKSSIAQLEKRVQQLETLKQQMDQQIQQLKQQLQQQNSSNTLLDLEDDSNIVVVIPNQAPEVTQSSLAETTPRSGRFKLTVLDDAGEQSDSLDFSYEDKERENDMKNYYESKITQLLNKISNVDAKALRYYEQYNTLLKKGQSNDLVQKELEKAQQESKNIKEELEVTRVNYDQQMKMLTEQYISLNESITHLDSDLIRIKQHKVVCAKFDGTMKERRDVNTMLASAVGEYLSDENVWALPMLKAIQDYFLNTNHNFLKQGLPQCHINLVISFGKETPYDLDTETSIEKSIALRLLYKYFVESQSSVKQQFKDFSHDVETKIKDIDVNSSMSYLLQEI